MSGGRLGFGLSLEQSQKLIMTPELRQAINILQFSAIELREYVEQELLENPVLELKEDIDKHENTSLEAEVVPTKEESYDMDWLEYFSDRSDLGYIKQDINREESSYENFVSQAPNLHETLLLQLSYCNLTETEREIGEYLIGNIDDHGYLVASLEELVSGVTDDLALAEIMLKLVQSFEPHGVGARNLIECLLIQVDALEINSDLLKVIIQHYLHDVAEGRLQKIAKETNVGVKEIQDCADILKTLDPKPGRKYSSANDVRYVMPDVVVEKIDDEYIILVNDVSAPRLGINKTYKNVLKNEGDPETKRFVENRLNSASWLIKSIEQRRLTLYKVANCLVELQREFLEKGIRYLKPLNLKQVAELVDLHESTISRATSNKYIQTPKGVFEMKYFFSSGIDNSYGDSVSSQSVKKMIVELIEKENTAKPFSDQKIANILEEKGINISRRTVAKYRDELGLPAASKRKRY